MQRLLNFLLLAILFLIPLIPVHFGFGYELIKVFVFLNLILLAGLIFVYLLSKKAIKIHWTKLKIAAAFFLLVLSLSSVMGIHPFESLVGKYPYYQGLILYWFLFLFFLIVSEAKLSLKSISQSITFSAVIVALIAISQFILINAFKIDIPVYAGRVVSTFGQPNLFSGFLLLSLVWTPINKKNWLVFLIIILGIIVSFSKTALILMGGLGVYLIFKKMNYSEASFGVSLRASSYVNQASMQQAARYSGSIIKKARGFLIFLSVFLGLNLLVISVEQTRGIVWEEIIRPLTSNKIEENHIVEKRIYILPIMLNIYTGSPIIGFGLDSINDLYSRQFADFKPELRNYPPLYFNLKNLNVDRSHNYFLDLMIFSGFIGLISYGFLLHLLFKKAKSYRLKVFLVLYLVWVQFQVQSIVHLMLFWLVAGIIDNGKKLSDDEF